MLWRALQAIAAGWLIYRLKGRYPLRMAGRDAMKNLSKFLGPTGEAHFCSIAWCEAAEVVSETVYQRAIFAWRSAFASSSRTCESCMSLATKDML